MFVFWYITCYVCYVYVMLYNMLCLCYLAKHVMLCFITCYVYVMFYNMLCYVVL